MKSPKWLIAIGCFGFLVFVVFLAELRKTSPDLIVPFGLSSGVLLYIGSGVFLCRFGAKERAVIWLFALSAFTIIAAFESISPRYPWRIDYALFFLAAFVVPFAIDLMVLLLAAIAREKKRISD